VATPAAFVFAVPPVSSFGPSTTENVTSVSAIGVSSCFTVAVSVCLEPMVLVASSGVSLMSLMTDTPRARMYGAPVVPSGAWYSEGMSRLIASTSKVRSGQVTKPSCVELPQFESAASVRPSSAGCVATMWVRSAFCPRTEKAPNSLSTATGVPVAAPPEQLSER
jgi:hypothetical protein